MVRSSVRTWATLGIAAAGGVVAGVVVPGVTIAVYALVVGNPERIGAFASAVAEPLALVGSTATVATVARFMKQPSQTPGWGALLGCAGAVAVAGAAFVFGDADVWTAAAAGILPLSGYAAALRRARSTQISGGHSSGDIPALQSESPH